MDTPEKTPPPEHKRPVSKATMDKPQEEFIADEAGSVPSQKTDESPRPAPADRSDAE